MSTVENIAFFLLTLAVLAMVTIARPTHARCPDGWWLSEGVRETGEYSCVRRAAEQLERTPHGGWIDVSEQPPGKIESRVYCTGGMRAVTVDGVDVGCQPGGWR